MLAPIQLSEFFLARLDVNMNAEYDPEARALPHGVHFRVRGEPLLIAPSDVTDADPESLVIGQCLDVETSFMPGEVDDDGTLRAEVYLSVDVNEDDETRVRSPLSYGAAVGGVFIARDIPEGDEREAVLKIVRANGAALLYSSVRTILHQALRLTPYAQIAPLPALSFQTIIEREIEMEEEEARGTEISE